MPTTEYGSVENRFLCLICILLIFITLVFLFVPSYSDGSHKAKELEAKYYIAAINKAQQAYYAEHQEFSDNIYDLGLGIKLETTNYSYDISKVRYRYVISTATAKKQTYKSEEKKYRHLFQLKSYSGIVYVADDNTTKFGDDNRTKSIICQTDQPSLIAPNNFESVDKCPSGSSEVEY